jgi:hypothetical protein
MTCNEAFCVNCSYTDRYFADSTTVPMFVRIRSDRMRARSTLGRLTRAGRRFPAGARFAPRKDYSAESCRGKPAAGRGHGGLGERRRAAGLIRSHRYRSTHRKT